MLMVSPSATSPKLTDEDTSGLLWRTAPSDERQGEAIADDMKAPGQGRTAPVSSVAVIYNDDAYGHGLQVSFATAFELAEEGTVKTFAYSDEKSSYIELDRAIANAGRADVEEVLFISAQNQEIRHFMDAIEDAEDYVDKNIFLTDMAATREVLSLVPESVRGRVRGSRPAPLDPSDDGTLYPAFLSSYEAQHGDYLVDETFTANAYDAAWLVAYGAAWAVLQRNSTLSAHNMADGLRQLSASNEQQIEVGPQGWERVLEEFAEGRAINITGASGDLDYDP
ncbi:ABC transporter substrate-binding protein [Haliangium sp.]|uniref:ABC transporter substrate-binding protein n=1 Tax=Haliangium sp. TaxID=2663208 RepID=UPI003D14D980